MPTETDGMKDHEPQFSSMMRYDDRARTISAQL
jgi:hypothetical protein